MDTRLAELARVAIDLGAQGVKAESKRLQAEAEALEAKAVALEQEAEGYIEIADVTDFLNRVRQVPEAIRKLTDTRARYNLITSLVPKIVLTQESIQYEINFLRNLPDFGVKLHRSPRTADW
jgi:hypothetical protein